MKNNTSWLEVHTGEYYGRYKIGARCYRHSQVSTGMSRLGTLMSLVVQGVRDLEKQSPPPNKKLAPNDDRHTEYHITHYKLQRELFSFMGGRRVDYWGEGITLGEGRAPLNGSSLDPN